MKLYGCVGCDERGMFLLESLKSLGVESGVKVSKYCPTSATIIPVRANGDRPCLHEKGASDSLLLLNNEMEYIAQNACVVHIGGFGLESGCNNEKCALQLLEILRQQSKAIVV